jgi:drug/metabolite transporter (DMT)-like permease
MGRVPCIDRHVELEHRYDHSREKQYKTQSILCSGMGMFISALIIMVMLFISGDTIPLSQIPAQAWGALAYLVIMSNIITFIAFIYTMKHLEPAKAALYAYINPIVAIFTGSLLLMKKLPGKLLQDLPLR